MINKKFEFEAEDQSSDQLKALYILLEKNEFTAAIKAGGKFLYAVKYNFQEGNVLELGAALQDFKNQNKSYTKSSYFIYPNFVNMLPNMAFAEVHEWYMGAAKESNHYLYADQSVLQLVELNCLDKELYEMVKEYFPNAEYWSALDQLMPAWNIGETAVYLNFRNENNVIVTLKQDKTLLGHTIFEVQNNEDVLYFVVNLIQKHNLDPLQMKVYLSPQRINLRQLFKAYFEEVKLFDGKNVLTETEMSTNPSDFYFML